MPSVAANSIHDSAMVFGQMDLTDGNPTTSNTVQSSFNELAKQFRHGHILSLGLTFNQCLEFLVKPDGDGWIFVIHCAGSNSSKIQSARFLPPRHDQDTDQFFLASLRFLPHVTP